MKSLKRIIPVIFLCLATACGTTHGKKDIPPESFSEVDDFYESLWVEMEYNPDQKALIDTARDMVGWDYNYGGQRPTEGFDCSGFTRYVFDKALGLKLPRTSAEMSKTGTSVENQADLQAGDLVFFNLLGYRYSHVGIYIGNGRFFHASTNRKAIVIGNMKHEYFAKRYNGARRVLYTSS